MYIYSFSDTMNYNIDVKHEEDPLSCADIKPEPLSCADIKPEPHVSYKFFILCFHYPFIKKKVIDKLKHTEVDVSF